MPRTVIMDKAGHQAEVAEGQEKIWETKGYTILGYRREDGAPVDLAEKPVDKKPEPKKPETKKPKPTIKKKFGACR